MDSYSPAGRQFWASDIDFQSNVSNLQGRLFIYGGNTVNQVYLDLSKPNGYTAADQVYSFNISLELLNQSNSFSSITTTGFNVNL